MNSLEEVVVIVKRLKEGENEAFEELYDVLWDSLFYYASKLLNGSQETPDVLQDVLTTIYFNIHKLKDDYAIFAWSRRIVFNKCNDVLRKNYKDNVIQSDVSPEELIEGRTEFLPEEVLLQKETSSTIAGLIDRLTDDQKHAIMMYYFWGMSTKEISLFLNLSDNSVRMHLSRARAFIKKGIISKGVRLSSVTITAIPVITRILQQEMQNICTPEAKTNIWMALQASLAGAVSTTAVVSKAGLMNAKTIAPAVYKSMVSVLLVSGVIGGTIYVTSNTQDNDKGISTRTEQLNSSPLTQKKTDILPLDDLEGMMGVEDANTIRSLTIESSNKLAQLTPVLEHHEITRDSMYLEETSRDFYAAYHLDKEEKRLIIATRYNPTTDIWIAKYEITDVSSTIPTGIEIKKWFD